MFEAEQLVGMRAELVDYEKAEVGSAIVGHCADSQRRHSDSTDERTREHGWSSHLSLLKWCRKQQG
ncbi:MAG TPA: hypothetical protein VN654_27720 [Vicinamibacterales bacterium]|jgi:hypothetical protein|nr:hypothetical protein [Vicinamibacterales bacterium]